LYNKTRYTSCIIYLNDLLKRKSFKNQDTLSIIQYFLGNSYLSRGLMHDHPGDFKLSLQAFSMVGRQSKHFEQSRYCYAIALAGSGKFKESVRLVDSLYQFPSFRIQKIKNLRDSLDQFSKR
jgi:hypothetical protein